MVGNSDHNAKLSNLWYRTPTLSNHSPLFNALEVAITLQKTSILISNEILIVDEIDIADHSRAVVETVI